MGCGEMADLWKSRGHISVIVSGTETSSIEEFSKPSDDWLKS